MDPKQSEIECLRREVGKLPHADPPQNALTADELITMWGMNVDAVDDFMRRVYRPGQCDFEELEGALQHFFTSTKTNPKHVSSGPSKSGNSRLGSRCWTRGPIRSPWQLPSRKIIPSGPTAKLQRLSDAPHLRYRATHCIGRRG